MPKQGAVLREMWRKRYISALDSIFEEHKLQEILITPDDAMELMEELLEIMSKAPPTSEASSAIQGVPSSLRFDFAAFRREAHHYAVDRFYKAYYGIRKGAPGLSLRYLDYVLQLRNKGANDAQIAKRVGRSKDAVREEAAAAQRIWDKTVRSIRELSDRSLTRGKN